jgi:hypothetical protein
MDFDDNHALCALRRRLPKDLHGAAVCEQISDTRPRRNSNAAGATPDLGEAIVQATGIPFASDPRKFDRANKADTCRAGYLPRASTRPSPDRRHVARSARRVRHHQPPAAARSHPRSDDCGPQPCPAAGLSSSPLPPGRAPPPGCRPRFVDRACQRQRSCLFANAGISCQPMPRKLILAPRLAWRHR